MYRIVATDDNHFELLDFRNHCVASTKPNRAQNFRYFSVFAGKPLLHKDKITELISDTPPRQETWLNGKKTEPGWPVMIETVQFNCVWHDWEEPNWRTIPKLEIVGDQAYMIIKRLIQPKHIKEVTQEIIDAEKKNYSYDPNRIRSGVYTETQKAENKIFFGKAKR